MDYYNILKTKIKLMITNDLTIGRTDNDLIPFTSVEIDEFIENNKDNIEQVITTIINEYSNDNELELLKDPLLDWIGEYLYVSVDTTISTSNLKSCKYSMELCPICIEKPAENYTECGHSYCIGCLSRIKSCSICRKSLLRTQLCEDIRSKYNNMSSSVNFNTRDGTNIYSLNMTDYIPRTRFVIFTTSSGETGMMFDFDFGLTPEDHMPSAIYDTGNSINHSVLNNIIYRTGRTAPITRN